MHARITTLRPRDGHMNRVLGICEDVVTPAAERQKGFTGLLITSDKESGKVLAVSLWDTEADMLASESGEYLQEQIANLILSLSSPPEIEHHQVDVMF